MRLKDSWALFKDSWNAWSTDKAPRLGAALAYYTTFSRAPLLVIVIAIAALVFGREAVQGKIVAEIGGLMGTESASAIQTMNPACLAGRERCRLLGRHYGALRHAVSVFARHRGRLARCVDWRKGDRP